MKLPHMEVKLYSEMKSQTGSSRVSCKRPIMYISDIQYVNVVNGTSVEEYFYLNFIIF